MAKNIISHTWLIKNELLKPEALAHDPLAEHLLHGEYMTAKGSQFCFEHPKSLSPDQHLPQDNTT